MDEARFQEAKQAYAAGDYRTAAKGFLAAAGRGTDGNGVAYHMAGNSLLRLRRHADAVTVYGHALKDEVYTKHGAVRANLAAAYVALAEYPKAVEEYRAALEEPDYANHFKALQGMAGAWLEMGRMEEAAIAYRQAALDSDNPDPGKALNNLGLCFMALGRPQDAVEAYKAALGFEQYAGRGKALANLGLAFSAMGEHKEAVKAFEKSIQLHGHELSPDARAAFERSREALTPKREIVEGWQTGEIPPVVEAAEESSSQGWDTGELEAMDAVGTTSVMPAFQSAAGSSGGDTMTATGELFGDQEEMDTAFFTMTDQEMRDKDRESRRAERTAKRDERNPWTIVATVVLVIVIIVGTVAAAYFSGYGFPTQTMTVKGMLDARVEGTSVGGYWVAVPSADVDKEMAKLPAIKSYTVGVVERSPKTSKVSVTVTPEDGAPLSYEITLAREGVGWKVSGVANDWRSTDTTE